MNSLDPSLAKYLSSSKQDIYNEYHTTSSSTKKKSKKRKLETESNSNGTGLLIQDSSADSWNPWSARLDGNDEDDDRVPVVEHRTTSIFKPVAGSSKPTPAPPVDDADPADEAPLIVGKVIEEAPTAGSSTSAFAPKRLQGGLQTAAQLREENERRRAAREAEKEAARVKSEGTGDAGEETVYRDRSGKKIDTKAEKAELQRKKRQELEKEMQKMEWGKGLVQREDRERRQRELEEMANRDVARYADDRVMNEEMKEVQRWNDPAARFLTEGGGSKSKGKSKGPQRPKYSGPMPPPNRFAILPGYRWDGVDRSNGFERELMQQGNKRKIQEAAARVFSTEDM